MTRRTLTDHQWARIEGLLSGKQSDPGRSGVDNRLFVDAILWMAYNAARWRDLTISFVEIKDYATEFENRMNEADAA